MREPPAPSFCTLYYGSVSVIIEKTEKERGMTVRRFLLGILIIVVTLGLLVGTAFLLSYWEKQMEVSMPETVPMTTEQTIPETTVLQTIPETEPTEETLAVQVRKKTIDAVPRYYQTDYPDIPFGNGTIATSGCSVTCLAMVATYLTDKEYTPPQMAYHFGSYGNNHIERLNYGISQMHLPCYRAVDVQDMMQAVRNGKIAIEMVNSNSYFTESQHFFVVAGVNEDGKFIINDPMETNYTNADVALRDGYDNGFEYYYLTHGYSGAWIFDKEDMKDISFRYDAAVPDQERNRYKSYNMTKSDIETLARFVYAEAKDEPSNVKQAVAEVVLNRVISSDYPNTVRKVIHETEFSRAVETMNNITDPGLKQYIAVDAAMYGPYILPKDICFYSIEEEGNEIWGKLGNFTFTQSP